MALISVIIPAYNAEATIAETIRSVLTQTFSDFEIIIINDGSTDNTLQAIQQFADPRIQVYSFANAGPQTSRNRGIDRAVGDYVALLDADDVWSPDKLASQLEALQSCPQAAVAYSWTDIIDATGAIVRSGKQIKYGGDVFAKLLRDNFVGSGSNPLVKAAALRTVGGFDEAIVAGQDWDMWLTLAAQHNFVGVPKVQVFYRKAASAQSWSSNLKRQEEGLVQVMEKHLSNRHPEAPSKSACLAQVYRYLLFECFAKCAYTFQNGLWALHFFIRALKLEPRWWLQRSHLIGVVLLKLAHYLIPLPQPQRQLSHLLPLLLGGLANCL